MGIVLDLAAVALALVVTGSLVVLAWTLGVSAVKSARRGRRTVAEARARLARAESHMREVAAGTRRPLQELAERTRVDRRKGA